MAETTYEQKIFPREGCDWYFKMCLSQVTGAEAVQGSYSSLRLLRFLEPLAKAIGRDYMDLTDCEVLMFLSEGELRKPLPRDYHTNSKNIGELTELSPHWSASLTSPGYTEAILHAEQGYVQRTKTQYYVDIPKADPYLAQFGAFWVELTLVLPDSPEHKEDAARAAGKLLRLAVVRYQEEMKCHYAEWIRYYTGTLMP